MGRGIFSGMLDSIEAASQHQSASHSFCVVSSIFSDTIYIKMCGFYEMLNVNEKPGDMKVFGLFCEE